MVGPLVFLDRPSPGKTGHEHPGVRSTAVVVDRRGLAASPNELPRRTVVDRRVNTAVKSALVESDLLEHTKHRFDVSRLRMMGCAENGKLALRNPEAIDTPREDGGHHL